MKPGSGGGHLSVAVAVEGNALVFIGHAVFSRGARPDVQAAFPAYPDSDAAGWGYMVLTNMLPNQGDGASCSTPIATNYAGQTTLLGSSRVTLANARSPPVRIDRYAGAGRRPCRV